MGGNRMPTSGRFPFREQTTADDGFNRGLVPPAMSAIRPRSGMTYGLARLVVGVSLCLRFFIAWRRPAPRVEMVAVKRGAGRDMDV